MAAMAATPNDDDDDDDVGATCRIRVVTKYKYSGEIMRTNNGWCDREQDYYYSHRWQCSCSEDGARVMYTLYVYVYVKVSLSIFQSFNRVEVEMLFFLEYIRVNSYSSFPSTIYLK